MGVLLKLLTNHHWHVAPADLKRVISYGIKNLQDFSAYQQRNLHVVLQIYIDNFIVIIMAGKTSRTNLYSCVFYYERVIHNIAKTY